MPLISVIIPAHNRANLLIKCLDSLVHQSFKDFEVIVIDDASKENISEVTKNYKDRLNITYIRNENSMGGPARPRNIGINASAGEWIAFLDNDDWWYPNKLERVVAHFEKADVIYHELDVCDGEGKLMYQTSSRQLHTPVLVDLLVNSNAITNSSSVARKSLIQSVGGIDEAKDLIAVEDYDLWLQLAQKTENFLFLNEFLGGYYVGEGNISKSSDVQIKRLDAVFNKNMKHLTNSARKEAEASLAYCKGYCYFQMADGVNARKEFSQSIKSASFKIKLKSIARYFHSIIKS